MYEVVDRKTNVIMGKYKTRQSARRAVDRLDNAYGGYRYFSRSIEEINLTEETMPKQINKNNKRITSFYTTPVMEEQIIGLCEKSGENVSRLIARLISQAYTEMKFSNKNTDT
jgi:NhaP-type Na+/H+ and K+/H+ antiporter